MSVCKEMCVSEVICVCFGNVFIYINLIIGDRVSWCFV